MVTLLKEGITIHSDAEGSAIQSAKVSNKREKALVTATVDGETQVVKVFSHTEKNAFNVVGKGDITMAAGLGQDTNLTLLTGGVSHVDDFSYEQKGGDTSSWSYEGEHFPHAA